MAKDWSGEEIELLKSMAEKEPIDVIVQSIGRTKSSIEKKASRLNLSLATSQSLSWTEKEIETLQKLAGKYSAEYIGKQLGKSANAVRVQASKMNLSLKQHPWTDDEVMLLELLAGEHPVEVIANRLNRPIGAVRQKAYRSDIDLALSLDNYSAKALAEMLGICRNTVATWARNGKLQATRTSEKSQGVYRITRKSFKAFYRQYKDKIRTLKTIDPVILEYVING